MITVKVQGLDAMLSRFKRIPPKLQNNLNIGIQRAIFNIERKTKPITPVDTGRLRASIGGGSYKGGSYAKGHGTKFRNLYGEIGSDVEYAEVVHQRRARHKIGDWKFLEKGTQQASSLIKREFKTLIERALQ